MLSPSRLQVRILKIEISSRKAGCARSRLDEVPTRATRRRVGIAQDRSLNHDGYVIDHHAILDHSSASPAAGGTSSSASATSTRNRERFGGNRRCQLRILPRSSNPPALSRRRWRPLAGRNGPAAISMPPCNCWPIAPNTLPEPVAPPLPCAAANIMTCFAGPAPARMRPNWARCSPWNMDSPANACARVRLLRCDDAERDPRVNREGCRDLGIASVVVMPIVSDEQVLGVFELFSGKPRAFESAISPPCSA